MKNRYKTYKDSGIEWLGEIPEHWEVKRLKNLFSLGTGLSITKKNLLDIGVPCVSYGEIHSKYDFEVNPQVHLLKCVEEEYLITSKRSLLKKGDFIFADTSEDIEGSGNFTYLNSDINVFAGYHTIAAKPKRKFNARFIAYLFDSITFRHQIRSNVAGIKVYSITQGLLNKLFVYLPPNQEQTAIVQYLDTKTQAIDQKVRLLEKKIGYYKELRKSIINDAVTKGLDNKVELKDSGIDWIGQIPVHWNLKRVKDLFIISRGRVIAKTELLNNGKFPVYSSQTENEGILGYINTFDFETDLITWTTDGVNAGTVFRRIGKFSCTNICGTLIPKNSKKTSLDYFGYAIAESTKHNKRIDTNGAKIMSNEMAVIHIIEPPHEEQIAIAQYLDQKTQTIDLITANIQKQITALKELRKTLINEVVTGKKRVYEPIENTAV